MFICTYLFAHVCLHMLNCTYLFAYVYLLRSNKGWFEWMDWCWHDKYCGDESGRASFSGKTIIRHIKITTTAAPAAASIAATTRAAASIQSVFVLDVHLDFLALSDLLGKKNIFLKLCHDPTWMNKVNLRDSQVLWSGDGVSSMSALQGREVDLSQVKWAEGGGVGQGPRWGGGGSNLSLQIMLLKSTHSSIDYFPLLKNNARMQIYAVNLKWC